MAQQTAVEWLIEQLKEYDFADLKDNEYYIIKIPAWVLTEKEEQAKQMEKEQIIYAYMDSTSQFSNDARIDYPKTAKQYYKETYNK